MDADADAIVIRGLLPGDVPAACALFAAGMMETIEGGLRSAALRPSLGAGLGALALAAAHQLATRKGGVAPSTAHAAAAAAVGAAVILAGWALPRSFASEYVEKSLAGDMADPVAYYAAPRGAFWVAVDATLGTVVGTVAVEAADAAQEDHGWRWKEGDAELRRMSVGPSARGKGVARRLLAEVRRHCEQHGFKRIVLSTTTMQTNAVRMCALPAAPAAAAVSSPRF